MGVYTNQRCRGRAEFFLFSLCPNKILNFQSRSVRVRTFSPDPKFPRPNISLDPSAEPPPPIFRGPPLLRCLEGGASTTRGVTPLSKAKESLKVLNIEDMFGINIDPSFVSTIQCFRNLVDLNVDVHCPSEDDEGECIFKLNDDNITELAMALTRPESLLLGHPCSQNTCLTTIACLLPISVHCSKLKKLMIHFNTTNIVDDFRNILEDPRFQQLRSLPKCPLKRLYVYRMPLSLDESDFGTVAKGMVDIFPSLTDCDGLEESWNELSRAIAVLREDSG